MSARSAPATARAQQPLFYAKAVPLSRERHKDWWIRPTASFEFARKTNCVYVAAAEFVHLGKEYPVVFGRSFGRSGQGALFPVALLGLRNDENLYLAEDGTWRAHYIPAYVRRYPFVLAPNPAGDQFVVCIDEGYPGFNREKRGQPLFTEDGRQAPVVEQTVAFLRDYQAQVQATEAFCARLQEFDLVEAMQARVSLRSGQELALGGFHVVSKAKLKALAPERLAELAGADQLDLIYAHLQSLLNVNNLMERLS